MIFEIGTSMSEVIVHQQFCLAGLWQISDPAVTMNLFD